MEKLGVKKSGVLAVLLIVLFVTSVFSVFSITANAAKPEIIKIGVIVPWSGYLGAFTDLYKKVVEPDINAYVAKLPEYRFIPPVKFEFQVVSAGDGTLAEHLAQVKMFHKMGVDLIIGGFFSSQINDETLQYLKTNKMVMISPSSNAPSLAKVDNLFRLLPDASTEGPIVAAMFAKLGLTKAIVIEDNGDWGNGVYQSFKSSFSGAIDTYPYTEGDSITNVLNAAESAYNGAPGVGIFLIAVDSDCAVLNLDRSAFLTAYPKLGVIPWFGADGTAFSMALTAPNIGALKILSPNPATPHNTKFDKMAPTYATAMGTPMDYGGACMIDAGWMLAQAVIETRSTFIWKTPGATDVIKVLIDDSSRYFGYSGWCQLDQNGDRVSGNWDIVGYGLSGGSRVVLQYGSYDLYSKTVSWTTTPTWP